MSLRHMYTMSLYVSIWNIVARRSDQLSRELLLRKASVKR
jgi:hypothetical protein